MPTITQLVKTEIEVDVEFEICCSCGNSLSEIKPIRTTNLRSGGQYHEVVVEQCRNCI